MASVEVPRLIKNEDDAYELLQEVLAGKYDGPVKLDGWPHLKARLTGSQFHRSITPSVMRGYTELQNSLYKSYAATVFNDADVRHLTREEKESLELTVEVGDGSALYDVDLTKIINHLIDKVSSAMTPHELLLLLLGLGLLYTGQASLRHFINARKDVRMKELDKEERLESLRTIEAMSEKETERLKILTKAVINSDKLQSIEPHASDATAELLKSFSSVDKAEIQGVQIEGEAIRELSLNARRKSEDAQIEGEYRVIRVDSSDPLLLRVKIKDENTDEIIEAAVQDELMSPTNRAALQNALFRRHSVFLTITGKMMEDKIKDAVIRKVRVLPHD